MSFLTTFINLHCPSEKWAKLIRYPRINEEVIPRWYGAVDRGYYQSGIRLLKNQKGYEFRLTTSENAELKMSCYLFFDCSGSFLNGTVNCFLLGFRKADEGYASEVFEELSVNFGNKRYTWDVVEHLDLVESAGMVTL